jgi:hypothetical protein
MIAKTWNAIKGEFKPTNRVSTSTETQETIFVNDNIMRFVKHDLKVKTTAVRFIPLATYHSLTKTYDYLSSTAHLFNFEVF